MLMGQGDATMRLPLDLLCMYRTDCESGWMYITIGCEKDWAGSGDHATPLISTLVDISTISVYFAIVSHVFSIIMS